MENNYVKNFHDEMFFSPEVKNIKDEPATPIEEDFGDHNHLDSFEDEFPMRKSFSMNDIAALREDFGSMGLQNTKEHVYRRQTRGPNEAQQGLVKNKFVSLAEAIYHYERDTPGRFHSSRPANFRPQPRNFASRQLTVAQSPMLRCKNRSRPLHILSQAEKEQLELEELRKIKIKARPIPKVVKEGITHLPNVERKPNTVPQPFKLTEPPRKPPPSPEPEVIFKARPAPRHILEKAHIPPKPPVQVTKPKSPKFRSKRANSENELRCGSVPSTAYKHKSEEKHRPILRLGPLKPIPFSFEKRDEQMKKRKEERIKQTIEEEKKQASQFKAQPLPGVVKKNMHLALIKGGSSTTSLENKENHIKFEARPALVLRKEPFKPIMPPQKLVKPMPFQLASEKRAEDREKFEMMLKQKEEEQEKLRQLKEKERLEAEEKAKIELRAKMVHHAKPVPQVVAKPFVPERSAAVLTVPETPKFVRRLRQQ